MLVTQVNCACSGGFQTVAVVGFVAPLAVTVLGPATGQLLDRSPREAALNFCAVIQSVCIFVSGDSLAVEGVNYTTEHHERNSIPTGGTRP